MMRRLTIAALLPLLLATSLGFAQGVDDRLIIPTIAIEPEPGAFGSLWVTEISLRYEGWRDRLRFFFPLCPVILCTYLSVEPNRTFSGRELALGNSPHGRVLRTDPGDFGQTHISVRARDLSRALDTWGTEIPVVRESEATTSPITLLNLPTSDRFRTTIRIYDFADHLPFTPVELTVTVFPLEEEVPLRQFTIQTAELPSQLVGFAVVTDLGLPPNPPERLRIVIESNGKTGFWAFATVTNNDTQHITVVSPSRLEDR